jgi:pyruvate dehydrogenase E1 component beta subunit
MTTELGTGMTTYREAVRQGLRAALKQDPRVFLMGEDVGKYGGCFAVSKGLLEEFGAERIRDRSSARSASGIRRCPSRRLSAPASVRHSVA